MYFLVTGGGGFIGSHLCERLIKTDNEVLCLDNFNDYYDPKIKQSNINDIISHSRFQMIKGDILDWELLENIFKKHHFDCIVHLAARAGVRPSIQNPRLYQKVNIEGTLNLLEFSRRYKIPKFILASSSSVYGNNKKVPFSEKDPVDNPISPYAATKKACELLAYTYSSLYSLSVSCLRFFTVYGPRQRPDMAIHKFTNRIAQGKEVPMYGDGSSRRDYTFITDIMDGIMCAIQKCNGYHIYNLGESQTIALNRLITLIENALDKKAKIKQLPEQPGDVRITYADISSAMKDLAYHPRITIEEGIIRFVQWYKKKENERI